MSSSIHQDHGAPTYALADEEGQHHLMVNHLNVIVLRLDAVDLSFNFVANECRKGSAPCDVIPRFTRQPTRHC